MDYDPKNLQSVLLYLRERYGAGALEEPRRMVAILLDLAPDLKRDGNVLRQMSEAGLLRELRTVSESDNEYERLRVAAKSRLWLTDYLQLPDERADFYMTALQAVYGLEIEPPKPTLTPQQKPAQSVEQPQKLMPKPQPVPPKPTVPVIDSGREINYTWTLERNGILTISGTGDMDAKWGVISLLNHSPLMPWSRYLDFIRSAVIQDGVTQIGTGAFAHCRHLTTVNIPDSVMQIGRRAFLNCENLTSVNIPDLVMEIGEEAFLGCKRLKNVSVPAHTAIGRNAFGKFLSFQTAVKRF